MVETHAKLSASGSKRWLTCTHSASLESEFPDSTSDFAKEGTAAHELSELKLMKETEKINKRTFSIRYNKFKKGNEYYSQSMDDYTDEYVNFVLEAFHATPNAEISLEQRVDFSEWVPEGFGTSDVVITSEDVIEVIDLKYGKGVPVSAENNPQAMLYALGAYHAYEMIYDFKRVKMTIVQPRLESISTFELPLSELLDWAENFVKPRADMAMKGEGEFHPDPEACRFCRAKGVCRARAEKNLEIARYEFQDSPLLSKEDIADILSQATEIKKWLEQVQEYALEQVRDHGEEIPGYKLVEGRSNRVITDKEKAASILEAEGFEEIFKPQELKAMGVLEKLVGKAKFTDLLSDFIIKPTGKPVLVVESDKREPVNGLASAQDDFAEDLLD